MDPRSLATILVALHAVGVISIVGLILSSSHPAGLMLIAFLSILTATVLPFVVPVRCPIPGCYGRMERLWRQDSNGSKSLSYQCRICGEVYDMPVHYGETTTGNEYTSLVQACRFVKRYPWFIGAVQG